MTRFRKPINILIFILLAVSACTAKSSPTQAPTPAPIATQPAPADGSWDKVKTNGKIVVGISADYPPFSFYNNDYQLDGFDVALMKNIGEKVGLPIEFKDMAFEGLTAALQSGQIDAAISAISVTDERRTVMNFSQVYFVSADAVLAAQDSPIKSIRSVEDIAAYRTGVERDTVYESWLQTNLVNTGKMSADKLFAYTMLDQEIKDLSQKRIDLAVVDLQPAKKLAKQSGLRIVAADLNRQHYAIATFPGANTLVTEINNALNLLQAEKQIAALAKQYLDLNQEDILPTPQPKPTHVPAPQPSPSGCYDSMAFIQDLTLPDNGMRNPPPIPAGSIFKKGWRVQNTGSCSWNTNYALIFVSTNDPWGTMKAQPVNIQGVVKPGGSYDFYASMQAPFLYGVYQSIWVMRNGNNNPFGDRIWAGITVLQNSVTPTPTTPPDPSITFNASPLSISPGQQVTFSWNAAGASKTYFGMLGAAQPVANPGRAVDNPIMPTNYELRVQYPDGKQKSRQVSIDVLIDPGGPVITNFDIQPEGEIHLGDCVYLSWNIVNNVDRVRLLRDGSVLSEGAPEDGSYQDCPPIGNHTYQLEAYNRSKMNSAQQHITVSGDMPTATDEPMPTWVPEPTYEPEPPGPVYPTEEPEPPGPVYPTDEPEPPGPVYPTDDIDGG